MNPPRVRSAKREHILDERKTVSVEGKVKGFKVASCKVSEFPGFNPKNQVLKSWCGYEPRATLNP